MAQINIITSQGKSQKVSLFFFLKRVFERKQIWSIPVYNLLISFELDFSSECW